MTKPRDLPREELQKLAEKTLRQMPGAVVHFKFTCAHCGTRCTLSDPNVLYEQGECCECGKLTTIDKGGFDLQFVTGVKR